MNLLAFELSTEQCSVAVLSDGELHQLADSGTRPSRRVLAMADELLVESGLKLAQLDAVAFGRGPGAFTGLRIAAGVAQGLAYGAALPLVPVSSLAALAQRAFEDHAATQVVAALDARMNEIYVARFRRGSNGLMQLEGEEQLLPPDALELPQGDWVGAGSGWRAWPDHGASLTELLPDACPDAAAVARLGALALANGEAVSADAGIPVYLRDTVAWQKSR